MKRDMDLARRIMLELESLDDAVGQGWFVMSYEGVDPVRVAYHVMLLAEAGLIEAMDASDSEGIDWQPSRLTWAGHEFLDISRDETRWQRAKKLVMEKGGGMGFEFLKQVLFKWGCDAIIGP